MIILTLLLALGLGGTSTQQPTDVVAVIEVNHMYCEFGRPLFCQHIFWEYRKINGRLRKVVVAWRLIKDSKVKTPEGDKAWADVQSKYKWNHPIQKAKYIGEFAIPDSAWPYHFAGGYRFRYFDGDEARCIQARTFRETFTQYDPERRNRDILPEDSRRGLNSLNKTPQPDDIDGNPFGAAIDTFFGPVPLQTILRALTNDK